MERKIRIKQPRINLEKIPLLIIILASTFSILTIMLVESTLAYTKLTSKQIIFLSTNCKFDEIDSKSICRMDYGLRVKSPVNLYELKRNKWVKQKTFEPIYYEDVPKRYHADGSIMHLAIPVTSFQLVRTEPTYMNSHRMVLLKIDGPYGHPQWFSWVKVKDIQGKL